MDNYYSDYRVRAANHQNHWYDIDAKNLVAYVALENEEGEEELHEVKLKFEVCPTCDGRGKHVNPSIDCNGISSQDFYDDPDFADDYQQGMYDVTCYGCKGERVVPMMDRNRTNHKIVEMIDKQQEFDEQYEAQRLAEIRMGA
jgi:hypothetical protein